MPATALQVEPYSNMIEPVVEALKYVTPMAFDVLTWVILQRLALDRNKVGGGRGVGRGGQGL